MSGSDFFDLSVIFGIGIVEQYFKEVADADFTANMKAQLNDVATAGSD